MVQPDRRRAERHLVDAPGVLHLSDGRRVAVRIHDLGELGALLQLADLEEAVLEGERAVLEHPPLGETADSHRRVHSVGAVVRVELDFLESGIQRQLAVFFDGGAPPAGYEAP
jgi:hypothetical protein